MLNYKISVENICPNIKPQTKQVKALAERVLFEEGILKAEINIVFIDDQYMIKLNQEFLDEDTTTDVLSFNLTDERDKQLEGEVYANIEQTMRQAQDYDVSPEVELSRVVIHGLLHLIGYNDQTQDDKQDMTKKEDHYLVNLPTKIIKKG